jgi:hypothetical protein
MPKNKQKLVNRALRRAMAITKAQPLLLEIARGAHDPRQQGSCG